MMEARIADMNRDNIPNMDQTLITSSYNSNKTFEVKGTETRIHLGMRINNKH